MLWLSHANVFSDREPATCGHFLLCLFKKSPTISKCHIRWVNFKHDLLHFQCVPSRHNQKMILLNCLIHMNWAKESESVFPVLSVLKFYCACLLCKLPFNLFVYRVKRDVAVKTTLRPPNALSTVSSFKAHAKRDSFYSASTSVSTRITAPDLKTVLSGRADKDVLSVFVLRIFVQDERKMCIFLKKKFRDHLALTLIILYCLAHIHTHIYILNCFLICKDII